MSDQLDTTDLSRLPQWIQSKIKELDVKEPEKWVMRPIPALGNQSVIEASAFPEGEALLRKYFSRVLGR